jgi:hypothetical protein
VITKSKHLDLMASSLRQVHRSSRRFTKSGDATHNPGQIVELAISHRALYLPGFDSAAGLKSNFPFPSW